MYVSTCICVEMESNNNNFTQEKKNSDFYFISFHSLTTYIILPFVHRLWTLNNGYGRKREQKKYHSAHVCMIIPCAGLCSSHKSPTRRCVENPTLAAILISQPQRTKRVYFVLFFCMWNKQRAGCDCDCMVWSESEREMGRIKTLTTAPTRRWARKGRQAGRQGRRGRDCLLLLLPKNILWILWF